MLVFVKLNGIKVVWNVLSIIQVIIINLNLLSIDWIIIVIDILFSILCILIELLLVAYLLQLPESTTSLIKVSKMFVHVVEVGVSEISMLLSNIIGVILVIVFALNVVDVAELCHNIIRVFLVIFDLDASVIVRTSTVKMVSGLGVISLVVFVKPAIVVTCRRKHSIMRTRTLR